MISPIVSIVLPVYNGERFLSEAIESCLSQTLTQWELILVDDCSTDSTLQIIQKYASRDSRIQVVRNSKNLRLPRSLNKGFKLAKGEFLTWTSDDNAYLPHALERMLELLQHMPEAGLVYSDVTWIDTEGKPKQTPSQPGPELLIAKNCVGACFLYRASIAQQVGQYNSEYFLVEDYEYWLRLALLSKLVHIPEPLYLYRLHGKSLTAQHTDMIKKRYWILQQYQLGQETVEALYSRKQIAAAYFNLWKTYPIKLASLKYLWKSLVTHPTACLQAPLRLPKLARAKRYRNHLEST